MKIMGTKDYLFLPHFLPTVPLSPHFLATWVSFPGNIRFLEHEKI